MSVNGFTNEMEDKVLNYAFGAQTPAGWPLSDWYVGASTTVPLADGTNFTEPSGSGYARTAVPNDLTASGFTTTAGDGTKENDDIVAFPTATGAWGTVIYLGLFEASSGGVPQVVMPAASSRQIELGDTLKVQANNLSITLAETP